MKILIIVLLGGWGLSAGTESLESADDLYIVDCLLPGQVRQLGTRLTYVSARRGIKTSARDCAVRGGEYVRHDRADYRSALSVWLPRAQEGDTEARLNVGTIYEQGLGAPPDYERAAYWYRLAAEEGSVRGRLKLAELYESGLGVPVDLNQALYWYQQATGSKNPPVLVVPPSNAPQGPDLGSELARLEAQIAAMAEDNDALREQLLQAQTALGAGRGEADDEQLRLRVQLERLQQELDSRDVVVADLRLRLAAAEDDLATALDAAALAGTMVEAARDEVAKSRSQVQAARSAAEAAAQEQAAVSAREAQARAEAERREAAIVETQRALDERSTLIDKLTRELTARESVLAAQRDRSTALEIRIDELQARVADTAATRDVRAQAASQAVLAPPNITLIDPNLPTTRGLVKVNVPVAQSTQRVVGRISAPAGLLSLTINGMPTQANDAGVFLTELPIAGASVPVSIVAVDQLGQRADLSFDYEASALTMSQAASVTSTADGSASWQNLPFGRYHALVIGNDNYQHLPQLETAVADARSVAAVLERRYGFQVTRLFDADRYQILSALNAQRENLTSDDNLLIYYAGHGELDQVNMRGHWLPVDAEPGSSANWISNVAVTDILNAMAAKQILVLADSCYSGSLTRSALAELRTGKTAAEEENWIRTMLSRRSRLAMTSGGLSPVLDAGGGQHSVFASALLEVLDVNRDLLEGRDLYEQVAARVAYRASNLRFEQVPEYAPIHHAGHEAGTFFLRPTRL